MRRLQSGVQRARQVDLLPSFAPLAKREQRDRPVPVEGPTAWVLFGGAAEQLGRVAVAAARLSGMSLGQERAPGRGRPRNAPRLRLRLRVMTLKAEFCCGAQTTLVALVQRQVAGEGETRHTDCGGSPALRWRRSRGAAAGGARRSREHLPEGK